GARRGAGKSRPGPGRPVRADFERDRRDRTSEGGLRSHEKVFPSAISAAATGESACPGRRGALGRGESAIASVARRGLNLSRATPPRRQRARGWGQTRSGIIAMQPSLNIANPAGGDLALDERPDLDLNLLLGALQAMRRGDFSVRLAGHQTGIAGKIADTFNDIVAATQRMAQQLE